MTTDITVGKIYNNGCGHCVAMANEWNIMKTKVIKGGVKVVEFETTNDEKKLEAFKNKHNIEYNGVPTLFKIGGDGKIEYYNGERTADKMAEWALNNAKSATNGGSKKSKKAKKTKRKTKTKTKTKKSCCWRLW
jgi:glutaredoxin